MNRFRDPTMRREYDAAMLAYNSRHPNLFMPDGGHRRSPNYGSSFAEFFWMGFDGRAKGRGFTDRASRNMIGYAWWRAGQDARKHS